ncbi:diaminopimelate decarboxylase [Elstera cyanobacteriorum]|uniref:Diaminopimelate decarboxylase n=1 Tax=Elstera cyanobacteriorum TaxID=2022747 RepID=A0A255XI05_9PROT|nr:diaminopimelate decarboxylase [Elstera cyanobacteriorum]OYQ16597.1 diaminopimelate decarboxylase [Elstera cyanobacteriorum]GFZ87147.1 diaminopimelate decarboxylase [Elstera cyanobacteriorum]
MSGFTYQSGVLHADAVPLTAIADAVGTPTYVYSGGLIRETYRGFANAFAGRDALVCYAVKANSNLAVLGLLGREGAGADCVSIGEVKRAVAAGIAPNKIVFAGVAKSATEIAAALEIGILQFNVESVPELERISAIAAARGQLAEIAIRVNPDVDAGTHAKITTGKKGNKFGIDLDQAAGVYAHAATLPGIRAAAVAMHIGSQITTVEPFEAALTRLVALAQELIAAGHPVSRIDCGGGVGIPYRGEAPIDLPAYAAMVKRVTAGFAGTLMFEPGRYLVGNAGALVSRVEYVKQGSDRRFYILDAGMNDLIRPAMYEAWHDIIPVRQTADAPAPVDVVGPICESSCIFAKDRPMPPLVDGDLIAILSAGAYSAAMASSYNTRALPAEVLVEGDRYAVIKARRSLEDLFADESPTPAFAPLGS